MKIEILYPEIANLFGDLANVRYIKASLPECEIIETDLNSRPAFLDAENDIDLVYMGTMSEISQLIAMEHLEPYLEEIRRSIDRGQAFLFTGNSFEVFAKDIKDLDDMPYDPRMIGDKDIQAGIETKIYDRVDSASKTTRCLGLFNISVKRQIMHRFNSLYLGRYEDLEIVGFKSVFTYAEKEQDIDPVFETIKGPGLDKTLTGEGIRINNFIGTYLTGPLMVLNPQFMIRFLNELGQNTVEPPHIQAAMDAYEQRLGEFKRDGINYVY